MGSWWGGAARSTEQDPPSPSKAAGANSRFQPQMVNPVMRVRTPVGPPKNTAGKMTPVIKLEVQDAARASYRLTQTQTGALPFLNGPLNVTRKISFCHLLKCDSADGLNLSNPPRGARGPQVP